MYGDLLADRNQSGTAYFAGIGAGVATQIWAGSVAGGTFAATNASSRAIASARAYTAYAALGDAVGVYQSSTALANGTFTPLDLLGFAPTIGYAGSLYRGAKGTLRGTVGASRGFGVNGQIGSLPTGSESSILKGLYLDQVGSKAFGVKLGIHNTIKKVTTLGGSKWVTPSDIRSVLDDSTSFRVGASTVHKSGGSFIVGGRESLGYFNRATSHHEMMHIGQYIRNPSLIDTRPIGYIHEIIPSFVGTPELYGGGTILIGGGAYFWVNGGGE